jgi:hypothetical protein
MDHLLQNYGIIATQMLVGFSDNILKQSQNNTVVYQIDKNGQGGS